MNTTPLTNLLFLLLFGATASDSYLKVKCLGGCEAGSAERCNTGE
jgi:hypothetical protein